MLTPQQVAERTFTKAKFGGYSMQEVDDFLDQITSDYNALFEENAGLKGKLKILADKIAEYRETEDVMRATLRNAQKTASDIIAEAESKREDILNALEEDIRARKQSYDDEIAACRAQLASAREETANYLAAIRDLTEQQQSFLERLPEMFRKFEETGGESADGEAEAPVAPEAAPVAEIPEAEDTVADLIAGESGPMVEYVPEEEEEVPAADSAAPEEQSAPEEEAAGAGTSRIDFSSLKFGKNYEIK